MRKVWQKLADDVTAPFLAALLLAAAYLGFVAWDQSHWWRLKDDYSFGWLVPALVAFVIYDRWPQITAAARACGAEGSPRAAGVHKWLLRIGVAGVLAFGVFTFLIGSLYRAGSGLSYPGTLAITLGAAGVLFPLLLFNAPASAAPSRGTVWSDGRVRLLRWFLFPLLVWLISAPMVSVIENQIRVALLRRVVTVVAFVFDLCGLPIEQRGNVLALPLGNVGVEDACSGIRSLTACLFAGSFLGAVFLGSLWKKILLVVAAMGFAFLTNLGRGLFLTAWAYHRGPEAIQGTVHDVAGYAVLGATVLGLLGLVGLMNVKFSAGPARPRVTTGPSQT